ncbi:MAG: pitrilysin family protein [Vicingaceae bacterium]
MIEEQPIVNTLKNGIRTVFIPHKSEVAHCGFIVDVGSRDEQTNEHGMAHFIEHAFFKGTKKRKPFHILNRIDSVGGEINAYTTKENTCLYSSFTYEYLDRSVELLSDILFNSTFPEKELEKEKDVIIDEIKSYLDNPFEQIYDDFEAMVFDNHPLSHNILGTQKDVKSIHKKGLLHFINRNYQANRIVFSIIGNFTANKVQKIIDKYISPIELNNNQIERDLFSDYQPKTKIISNGVNQCHCMLGNIAYSEKDERKLGFVLLNNLFGGPGMNSKLNINIREKYGLTYNLESTYTTYSDTGLFGVYLGTEKKNLDKSISLVLKEMKKLKEKPLSSTQIHQAKKQLIGQIKLSNENKSNTMLAVGKSLLTFDKVDTLEDVFKKIEKIEAKDLQDIANEIFNENQLSTLIFQPK